MEIRDKIINHFVNCNQYGRLTQSYAQKAFTVFNLVLSINLENVPNRLPIISTVVSSTQNELIETQLNIKYLLLCQSHERAIQSYDYYSRYEIELMKFVAGNEMQQKIIESLLPSTKDLYVIMENQKAFYPFGMIRAYEILSILISATDAFEKDPELIPLTTDQLIEIMETTSEQEGIDDITDAMWKYVVAHLKHIQIDRSHVSKRQIASIVLHARQCTQSYKSSSLRQTVTEVFSVIVKYFAECSDLELLSNFAELLLSLLRDDDFYVRNRISEIVMDLIHGDHYVQKGNCYLNIFPTIFIGYDMKLYNKILLLF